MPQLDFPVDKDGLLVDVVIGVDGATTVALMKAGRPLPIPVRARAAIDTGSDVTAVSTAILRQLGVPASQQATTHTVAGPLAVDLFEVSASVTDFAIPGAPGPVEANLLVMELSSGLPVIDVLIGLDMLLRCRFVLDGPGRRFSVDF
jgi:hypothetical protein